MSRSCNMTENEDNDTTPDAIAKRLREKIRLQAEALLSRCDESTFRSNISRQSSRVSTESMLADTTTTGKSPVSSSISHADINVHQLNSSSSSLEVTATSSQFQSPTSNYGPSAAVVTPLSISTNSYDDDNHTNLMNGANGVGGSNNSCCTTRSSSPSIVSSSTNNSTSNANELTKRIQKLALERQNQSSNHLFHHDNNQQRLKIVQSDTSSHLSSIKTFEELQLPTHLLHAIYQMGFNRPSYIQEVTLPRILLGRNVIGQAQSGSGKVCILVCSCGHAIRMNHVSSNI